MTVCINKLTKALATMLALLLLIASAFLIVKLLMCSLLTTYIHAWVEKLFGDDIREFGTMVV